MSPVSISEANNKHKQHLQESTIYFSAENTNNLAQKIRLQKNKYKEKMYSKSHCAIASFQVIFATILFAFEIVATKVVPSTTDDAAIHKPLLKTASFLYTISIYVPVILGFLVARRRRPKLLKALMIVSMAEICFTAVAIALQFNAYNAPVELGTDAANVVQTKFGLSLTLSLLLIGLFILQVKLCCNEVCDRRCYRTQDAYVTDVNFESKMLTVHTHHKEIVSSTFYSGGSTAHEREGSTQPASAPTHYFDRMQTQPLFKRSNSQCHHNTQDIPLQPQPTFQVRRPAPPPPR